MHTESYLPEQTAVDGLGRTDTMDMGNGLDRMQVDRRTGGRRHERVQGCGGPHLHADAFLQGLEGEGENGHGLCVQG